ncbi:MAG: cyclic nucleotide-binding domain-containing protein [bacterium]|nr:cyclic nucleotide-binding domain-containing protein [bacterium]
MADLKLKVFRYNPNSLVFVEGATSVNNFFIIKEGEARILRDVEISDNPQDNVLKTGDYFGVVACMSKRPRLETIKAMTTLSLISVEYDNFVDLIKNNKTVALKILKLYSTRLRNFDEAIARISLKKPSSSNPEELFNIAMYYYSNREFLQSRYAFKKFIQHCPVSENLAKASEYLSKLDGLVKEERSYIQESPLMRKYLDKAILFCENEPGEDVFIVQSGKIKITKVLGEQEVLLAVLNPGDIVGEMALIENKPRSANAIAFGDVKVMVINKQNFQLMVQNRPEITLKIIQLLSERIWVAYRQLENLAMPDEYGRLVDHLLIQIQKLRVTVEPRKEYKFDFGVDELLTMAGFDREKGYSHIRRLFEDPNYKLMEGKIVVEDVDELQKQVNIFRKKIKKDFFA